VNLNTIVNIIIAAVFIIIITVGLNSAIKKEVLEKALTNDSIPIDQSVKQHEFSKLEEEKIYRNYTIRIYRNDEAGDSTLQISHNGQIVFRKASHSFSIGHGIGAQKYDQLIPVGSNISGDGFHNLVVTEWTGGAHCCYVTHVFDLGNTLREMVAIDNKDSDTSHFERRSGERGLLFITYDFAFAYWKASFADSPAPKVILRYCNGEYRLADDLMRRPAPNSMQLKRLYSSVRKELSWSGNIPSSTLWSAMLDLIYSGNTGAAWKLFDLIWSEKSTGKAEFRDEFQKQLETSDYWEQIKLLNDGKPVCRK